MKLNYNGFSHSGGIYIIWNAHTFRTYVGSAKSFHSRWTQGHANSLTKNKHINKFLQSDFNKCKEELGNDDFLEFHVLVNMPGSTREERLLEEQKWIDLIMKDDFRGQVYNLNPNAYSIGGHNKGIPMTQEQKTKCSATMFKKGHKVPAETLAKRKETYRLMVLSGWRPKPMTEEHKAKLSAAKKGCVHSKEHMEKISKSLTGTKWTEARRQAHLDRTKKKTDDCSI